jgi:hypothetical protein
MSTVGVLVVIVVAGLALVLAVVTRRARPAEREAHHRAETT